MNTPLLALALVSAALLAAPRLVPAPPAPATKSAAAQAPVFPAASPPAKVEQRVGLTDIVVNYSRPSMKGRKIFGGLEPYGAVWRTGANGATTIQFSTDVKFGDTEVPAGTYSLFSIPGEKEWTVVLNEAANQWGAYAHDPEKDIARVPVKPLALGTPVETFAIGFSDLKLAGANFYFEWERVRVQVPIETDVATTLVPQIEAAMAGSGPKPYFQAAMFYLESGLDLKQALTWIDLALAEEPEAMWIVYRRGLILEKLGDKAGAAEAARKTIAMAEKAAGGIKDEYVRLGNGLLQRVR
jgi:tetratricopeptide (TPR) repeat protein